jgi:hypothetical protein
MSLLLLQPASLDKGKITMCGGAEHKDPRKPVDDRSSEFTYKAPELDSVYQQYRDTGQVPYSYYGVGGPTREGEFDLVRKSYPGAYTPVAQPPAPAPAPHTFRKPGVADTMIMLLQKLKAGVGADTSRLDEVMKQRNISPTYNFKTKSY